MAKETFHRLNIFEQNGEGGKKIKPSVVVPPDKPMNVNLTLGVDFTMSLNHKEIVLLIYGTDSVSA